MKLPPPRTSHHKTPFPKPLPSYDRWQYAWSTNSKLQHHPLGVARRAAPKPHTRGAVRRARAHTKQVVAQRRAVQPVVPRPRRRGHRRGGGRPPHVDAGVAALQPTDRTLEDMVHRADEALYAAKKDGKNRVTIARAIA